LSRKSWLLGFLVFFIYLPGAYSIEVGFSIGNGADSVSILDDYDVSNDISISEAAEAKVTGMELTDTREVAGHGDLEMAQTFMGSGGYTGFNLASALDSSSKISTSAILTPVAMSTKLSSSISGEFAIAALGLAEKESAEETVAFMSGGSLNTNMAASTGFSGVSQNSKIMGKGGYAASVALNWNNEYQASTITFMTNGNLNTDQFAKDDGMATAAQTSTVVSEAGEAVSSAGDLNGNYAEVYSNMGNGVLSGYHISEASAGALKSYGDVYVSSPDAAGYGEASADAEGPSALSYRSMGFSGSGALHAVIRAEVMNGVPFTELDPL
jgi:hypothetical protein